MNINYYVKLDVTNKEKTVQEVEKYKKLGFKVVVLNENNVSKNQKNH